MVILWLYYSVMGWIYCSKQHKNIFLFNYLRLSFHVMKDSFQWKNSPCLRQHHALVCSNQLGNWYHNLLTYTWVRMLKRTSRIGQSLLVLASSCFSALISCRNTPGNRTGQGKKANKQKFHHIFGAKSSLGKQNQKTFLRNSTKGQGWFWTGPGKGDLASCPWAMWLMKSLLCEG